MEHASASSPTTQHGFTLLRSEAVPEIDGTAHIYKHQLSGARLLHLQNQDPNKAFCISFKTPPVDDTGVFHILEHSVLCGSDKFPVKEPFVNLLKTSMQTFLNAMTFQDKTMYPVASTNNQDLKNLMDVYLDAVLRPAIYHKPEIFQQEGWHLELGEDGSPVINGVVFNEMKGALSDPDDVLYDALCSALFPDSAYRHESGGTPDAIPTLTYEGFLDHHKRHYRLDNSYLCLYGNMDVTEYLEFLDTQYLTPLADRNKDAGAPNPLVFQQPVCQTGLTRTMVTTPDNASMGAAFVAGTFKDRLQVAMADILIDALAGSNEAPLKRALMDARIASDINFALADGILQPFVFAQAKGLKEDGASRFVPALQETVAALLEQGLDKELIEASILSSEFACREANFGMSDGVAHAITSMSSWLFDDEDPLSYIHYEELFAQLKAALGTTAYEDTLRQLFLENPHWASVELVPVEENPDSPLAQRLASLKATVNDAQAAEIAAGEAALREAQEAPDAPENLAKLPQLGLADLEDAPADPAYDMEEHGGLQVLRHQVPTRGIAYGYRYYGLSHLAFEDLPYVGLLALVLGKLPTNQHTAAQLDTLIQAQLGNFSLAAEVHEQAGQPNACAPVLSISASSLGSKANQLAGLVDEILLQTQFAHPDKIHDLLEQKKIYLETAFANAGNRSAAARLASYYLPAGVMREALNGVDFCQFIRQLLDTWDACANDCVARLARLAPSVFADANCLISFAGEDAHLEDFLAAHAAATAAFTAAAGSTAASNNAAAAASEATPSPTSPTPALTAADYAAAHMDVPAPAAKNEAFIVSTDVTFSALGFDRTQLGINPTGAWTVASRILTYEYLWNEVRVKGGAYGVGFQAIRTGNARFTSYRDPHLDETIQRFRTSVEWLRGYNPTDAELEGFLVSTVAGLDAPEKPREIMRRQASWHLSNLAPDCRLQTRQQVMATTREDLRTVADGIQQICDQNNLVVFGNRDIIGTNKLGLTVIDLLK